MERAASSAASRLVPVRRGPIGLLEYLLRQSQDAHGEVTHPCHVLLLSYYCSGVVMGSHMESVW